MPTSGDTIPVALSCLNHSLNIHRSLFGFLLYLYNYPRIRNNEILSWKRPCSCMAAAYISTKRLSYDKILVWSDIKEFRKGIPVSVNPDTVTWTFNNIHPSHKRKLTFVDKWASGFHSRLFPTQWSCRNDSELAHAISFTENCSWGYLMGVHADIVGTGDQVASGVVFGIPDAPYHQRRPASTEPYRQTIIQHNWYPQRGWHDWVSVFIEW